MPNPSSVRGRAFVLQISILLLILVAASPSGVAQGIPWYTVPLPVPNGFVDVVSGNVHLEIPLGSMPQRSGDPIVSKIVYDTEYITPLVINNVAYWNGYGLGWGGVIGDSHGPGGGTFDTTVESCPQGGFSNYPNGTVTLWSNFRTTDIYRTTHVLGNGQPGPPVTAGLSTMQVKCYNQYGQAFGSGDDITYINNGTDGSGYTFQVTNYNELVIHSPDGTLIADTNSPYDQYRYDLMPVDTNGNTRQGSAPNLSSGLPVYNGCSTSTVTTSSGASASYTFTCTNLNISNVVNGTTYVGTEPFLTAVGFPDGTGYSFTYDTGTTGNHYGTLLGVTLPTGGTVSFTYTLTGTGWPSPMKATTVAYGGGTWNLSYVQSNCSFSCTSTATVLAPPRYDSASQTNVTDKSVFTSTVLSGGGFYLTTAQYYSGSSALLRTVTFNPGNVMPGTVTTTLNDTGQSSSVSYQYSQYGQDYPTQKQETDFNGTIVRTTKTAYGIFAKPTSVNVYAGDGSSGSPVSSTLYTYDEYSANYCKNSVPMLALFSGAYGHDDANFGTSVTSRGNVTTIQRLIAGTTYSTTHNCYDTLGNVTQVVDANSNPTNYDYSENWADTYCIPSGTITHAFPTTITDALGHRLKRSRFTCPVLTQSTKNENDIRASGNGTTFTYDILNRPLVTTSPDGGQTTNCYSHDPNSSCYTSTLPPFSTSSGLIAGSLYLTTENVLDAYGRVVQTQLTTDPDGATYTATTFDAFGRKSTITNPYRTTSGGTSTSEYDALGRVTLVIPPDGAQGANNIKTVYSGNCTTVADEAGASRKSCTDALGRLTQVFEDPTGLNYETDYTYDALDNLLSVTEKGGSTSSSNWRTRTFAYDSLSRLTQASNPESGTISYSYDANGNVLQKTSPAPNQTGSTTITLSYCYDALNRVTGKAYTAQTCSSGLLPAPLASYFYDQSGYNGLTIANGIGRRTGMSDQAGAEAWSYDVMGRTVTDNRTTNSLTKPVTYTYNLDGSLASLTYPTYPNGTYPVTVAYQPGGAGRPLNLLNNGSYFVGDAHYTPSGANCYLQDYWDGTWTSVGTFNNRQQPKTYQVVQQFSGTQPTVCTAMTTLPGTAIMDFSYNFVDSSSHNNGNVQNVYNNIDWHRTQSFSYDSLNRISSAFTAADNKPAYQGDNSLAMCWAEAFTYDGWGNLVTLGPNSTTQPNYVGCTQESGFNYTGAIGTNNRITETGFTYDAAGNMIASPGFAYVYDAENHLTQAAGVTYTYDGDGKRVTKSAGTIYWYGTGSDAFMETDLSNNMRYNYFFFNGQRVGRSDGSHSVTWYFGDHLGSSRVVWSTAANDNSDFYPFGGERVISSGTANTYKFTSKERDSESGLDNFGARYNSSTMGRFMSPDPENFGAKLQSPHTWNAYSYTQNNPLNAVDRDGRNSCEVVSSGYFRGALELPSEACPQPGSPNAPPSPQPIPQTLKISSPDPYDPRNSGAIDNAGGQIDLAAMVHEGPGGGHAYHGVTVFDALSCVAQSDPSDSGCWGVRLTGTNSVNGPRATWTSDAYASDRDKYIELLQQGFPGSAKNNNKSSGPPAALLDLAFPKAVVSPTAQSYICQGLQLVLHADPGVLGPLTAKYRVNCH